MNYSLLGGGPPRRSAKLSLDRRYRYVLRREWGQESEPERRMVIIGLNPSTADEHVDDPTIRRCIGFAQREGCTQLVMLNLFAFRAPYPRTLGRALDPIGPENDRALRIWTAPPAPAFLIAAWGAWGRLHGRGEEVAKRLENLLCFGTTMYGQPLHPLYLRADTPLRPYVYGERGRVTQSAPGGG